MNLYAAWLKKSLPILRKISQKTTIFKIPSEKPESSHGDLFAKCTYTSKGPDIQDDPELVRFNPRLDGLITLRQFNERFADTLKVGMVLCVSNTLDGLSGETYALGEDEYATVRSTLASTLSELSYWHWNEVNKIKLCFKNTKDELVKTLPLKAGDGEKAHYEKPVFGWFAPYGGLWDSTEFGQPTKKITALEQISPRQNPSGSEFRNILIQPGFFISKNDYCRNLPWRGESGGSSVTAVYGAAFDFTVTVTTSELHDFHSIKLFLE